MPKTPLRDFIRAHRAEIDEAVRRALGKPDYVLNDDERRLWVLNDEGLYLWARELGARVD